MSDLRAAERTIRQFARETNLLVAGRPARVRAADSTDPGAVALSRMLRALGAQVVDPEHDAPGVVDYVVETPDGPVEILLDGAPLPVRVDAAARIRFAGMHMPISAEISRGLSLGGLRIGVAMVLEPKTAQLALLLRDAGAEVAVYAHPDETDVAVAQALRTVGVSVTADPALSGEAERNAALGFLRRGFAVVIAHMAMGDGCASLKRLMRGFHLLGNGDRHGGVVGFGGQRPGDGDADDAGFACYGGHFKHP